MAGPQKQTRVKFSGFSERQEDAYNTQDGFNKEKKKLKPWFQRQFSDRKSEEDADLEFGAAIAAAAYAIMLAEEVYLDKKKPVDELGRSLTKVKSRREDNMNRSTGNSRISRWLSDKAKDDDGIVAGNSFKRKSSTLAESMKEEFAADLKMKEKAMNSTPRIKKTPTFSDKYLNETGNKPSEPPQDWKLKPSILPRKTSKPTNFTNGSNYGDRSHSINGLRKTYAWEQVKMEKIRKRNQKMSNTILQWENEKKVKARRRKERKEVQLDLQITLDLESIHSSFHFIFYSSIASTCCDSERSRD
ncbi:hypothetical protein KSP39_PZI019802 [Platanthera zijinensis]|uniref:Remorin C-terminal domain-containing protein n=1 Tax=Platanthera zijinensis TaxID=2320716 RepID=A0AAP0FYH4_9ASPA